MTTKVIMRNVEYVKIGKDRINSMITRTPYISQNRKWSGNWVNKQFISSRDMAIKNKIKIDTFVLTKLKRRIRGFFPNNKLLK